MAFYKLDVAVLSLTVELCTAITAQFNLQIITVFSHYQYKVVTFSVQLKPNFHAI